MQDAKTTSALGQLRGLIKHDRPVLQIVVNAEGLRSVLAAFEDEQHQRDERDAKIRKVLLALRGGQYMTVAKGVDEALALLDT